MIVPLFSGTTIYPMDLCRHIFEYIIRTVRPYPREAIGLWHQSTNIKGGMKEMKPVTVKEVSAYLLYARQPEVNCAQSYKERNDDIIRRINKICRGLSDNEMTALSGFLTELSDLHHEYGVRAGIQLAFDAMRD